MLLLVGESAVTGHGIVDRKVLAGLHDQQEHASDAVRQATMRPGWTL
jgi:hypothetical protein